MAISDKLQELLDIKQEIKEAIENKDIDLTDVDFGGYAGKIDEIQTQKEEQTKTVSSPNFASGNVVVTPDSGKVMTQVTVVKDEDLIPENIVKDVDIFGVLGTAETGGGGATVVELTQAQYDALSEYDDDTYYLISDTHKIYKGIALLYNLSTPNFLFYGGSDRYSLSTVTKANIGDLSDISILDSSVVYNGTIMSIAVDDTYFYVAGSDSQIVKKYLKSDLSYVGETESYGDTIQTIAVDDRYIYVGGWIGTIRRYTKDNLTYAGESPNYGGDIETIAIDDTHIYAGGQSTIGTVKQYLKSDLTYIGETPSYGSGIETIAIDDTHIYVGGTIPINAVKKYLKSDLSYVGETESYGDTIQTIAIDNLHIYAGGLTTNRIRKYLKSDLSYVGESDDFDSRIDAIAIDDTYIYIGGKSQNRVEKYLKGDLSYVGTTPGRSYLSVYAIAIG